MNESVFIYSPFKGITYELRERVCEAKEAKRGISSILTPLIVSCH